MGIRGRGWDCLPSFPSSRPPASRRKALQLAASTSLKEHAWHFNNYVGASKFCSIPNPVRRKEESAFSLSGCRVSSRGPGACHPQNSDAEVLGSSFPRAAGPHSLSAGPGDGYLRPSQNSHLQSFISGYMNSETSFLSATD